MAKAIKQIEREESNVEEERAEDLSAILKQIADNRKAIEECLVILQELHDAEVLPMLKSFLKTREKVGVIAVEQLNQPGAHNIIKNGMSAIELLASIDADQLKQMINGVNHGLEKVSENNGQEDVGVWGLMKSMRDPNVRRSLSMMINFLNGMGEGLGSKQSH